MGSEEDKGFTIRDRRSAAPDEKKDEVKGPGSAGPAPEKPARKPEEQEPAGPMPEVDFSSFILSLASTAQISLGAVPHPETGQSLPNLPVAKQMIDIIGMLGEKTKGNLTAEEQALVDSALFNLRMQYVRAREGKNKSGG
jgi:hypothetical protein